MANDETPTNETVEYLLENNIAHITLNRPDRLNAVTQEIYEGVADGLEAAEKDGARAVVLKGKGRAFCAGADLKRHAEIERSAEERYEYAWKAQDACRAIQSTPIPVITQIQGYAIGAGAEMAISSDLIVMADDAEMRLPEVSIGTYIGGGTTYMLQQRVGISKAKEIIFTSSWINGEEASDIGLANRVVRADELESEVLELAETLSHHAPIPMKFAKQHLNQAVRTDPEEMLEKEAQALLTCMETEDWQEGIDAFDENRKPNFTGE